MKIAILGATGHIAKSLINEFCRTSNHELFLFVRSMDRMTEFLTRIPANKNITLKMFNELNQRTYDVIINCVGIGDPTKVKNAGISIFSLTEQFDNLILEYLQLHPATLYINFSSGASFGTDFCAPVDDSTYAKWDINHISSNDYYGIAKLNSEAKHRALKDYNIIDLRVYGFFSRFIDPDAGYFLNEIISCIKHRKVFVTDKDNMIRDYIHPHDLIALVDKCMIKPFINDVFDVHSLKPVTKFEVIEYFCAEYELNYIIKEQINILAATGCKVNYYSENTKAQQIGYVPQFSSLESISQESRAILLGG